MSRLRGLAVAVAASLTFLALPPVTAHAATFNDTMPDANYRACVNAKLGLAADADPSTEQLATITELSCTSKGIVDVTGTAALTNLTKLFLGGNSITNIAGLASSTKIFSLGLENNQLSNIAPLGALTKLSAVTLAGNKLRDLSVLGTLPAYSSGSGTRYGQQAVAAAAATGVAAIVPTIVNTAGNLVVPTTPAGATVSGTTVTYAAPGNYEWTFRDPDDFYFNGKVTVVVTDTADTVPDAALRACLNTRIGNTDTTVQPTVAQLAALTGALSCANKGVQDLTGLNLATGLTSLTLNGNSISDVSPISALVNVTTANLALNEITSIAGLGTLPKLGTIQLQQNLASTKAKLQTLSGVNKLTGLTAITANYTAIRSLAPLAGNTSLKNLTATNNQLNDLTPLATAGSQLVDVDLSSNQISDLSPVKSKSYTKLAATTQAITAADATATQETTAPAVTKKDGSALVATPPAGVTTSNGKVTYASAGSYNWTFSFTDNMQGVTFGGTITQVVTDAPPPVVEVAVPDANFKACLAGLLKQDASAAITADQLETLTSVTCINQGILELTGAEHLVNATELVLSTNAISNLAPLTGLTKLTKLYLPGNAITDASALASLTGLDELLLSYNPISSISALAPLVNLTNLEVTQKFGHTGADLTSLDGVQGMTKLTRLVANNSSLTSLEPVAGLTSLKKLYVSNNQVTDLSPMQGLVELTGFGAFSNRISDVSPLAGLTKLTDVDLEYNQIGDLSALSGLTNLGYMGLKAQGQVVTAKSVPAQFTTSAPKPRTNTGTAVTLTAPNGITVTDGKVRYPAEGSYIWTFSAKDAESSTEFFAGTITQPVTAPVSGAADVPDANLRACLAEAAGLSASDVPTEAELGTVTSADCAGEGITDLTGAELLTAATALNLSGNPLGSIAPLEKLSKLSELNLASTGLTSVQELAGLTGLTKLNLDGNHLRDLSPLGALGSLSDLSAKAQTLTLADVAGGAVVEVPSVTTVAGAKVAATLPDGAIASDGGASFRRAGTYRWPFASGDFTGAFTQVVTSDVAEPDAQAGASDCVSAGKVWVVVERDTGLQQGGCASKFGTGLEALTSAGFTPTGTDYVTKIDGYPSGAAAELYWSYWHAANPVVDGSSTRYSWTYSNVGANSYAPKAGSIEGWRFESWQVDAVAPSWTPVVKTAATPSPEPSPSTPTTPAPEPTTPAPTPGATATTATKVSAKAVKVTYGKRATIKVKVKPAKAKGVVTTVVGNTTITAKLSKGKAKLVLPARSLPPGKHSLTVSFAEQGKYRASSKAVKVTVAKAKPKVTLKSRYDRATGVATIAVRVKSSAATPTGYVKVSLAGKSVRAELDASGRATAQLSELGKSGKRTVKAWYAGSKLLKSKTGKTSVKLKR